jgi:iron complex transport system permease protein
MIFNATNLKHKQRLALLGCVVISILSIALGLLFGSVENATGTLILELRLPRVLTAFSIGALLATTGNLLQIYTRNPLAEPSVLGISSGASVGALLALIFGVTVWVGAWVGAIIVLILLLRLAGGFSASSDRLLLAGVMLGTACGAMISLILTLTPESILPGILHWLMGDLQGATEWDAALIFLVFSTGLTAIFWRYSGSIGLLPLGWDKVESLGVNVPHVRLIIIGGSSLAVAVCVSIAGTIGFVGLVVPHALRLFFPRSLASNQSWMIPACALVGGSLLVLADLISRTILAPSELPVGVITAAIGVPVFLYLLGRQADWRGR